MIKRSTTRSLGMVGLFTLLMGAWAGIVVFVGPIFGYSVDGTRSWKWNMSHALLHLASAAAVLGGLLIMTALRGVFGAARGALGGSARDSGRSMVNSRTPCLAGSEKYNQSRFSRCTTASQLGKPGWGELRPGWPLDPDECIRHWGCRYSGSRRGCG